MRPRSGILARQQNAYLNIIFAQMGFGNEGAAIRGTRHAGDKDGVVPPGATLVYDLTLERVSIPPS